MTICPDRNKISGIGRLEDFAPFEKVHQVQGSGFKVQGSGFKVQGSRFKVQGLGFRVQIKISYSTLTWNTEPGTP